MEKKKFFSDVLFVQGLNVLIKTIWILVIDRAVQNLLPAEDYGLYYRLLSLSILLVILLDLGINNRNSTLVAQDRKYFNTNFRQFIRAKLILSLLYAGGLLSAGLLLGLSDTQLKLLVILMLFQTVNSFNQYFRSNLAALHLFKLDGFLAVADRLLVIIVCGAWLTIPAYSEYLTIENFALVQLGGVVLTLAIVLIANLQRVDFSTTLEKVEPVKDIIRSSLPYALLITLMAIFTRIDAVMIGQILGDGETDRYAMCYRLLDAANMMAALFSGMLLPMFARIITESAKVKELVTVASKVLILPAIIAALILAPHAEYVLTVMFPNKAMMLSPNTFIALLFSFIASASVFVFGTLLTAKRDLKSLNIFASIAALANIILNFILIPTYGIEGAAVATLGTQGFFAIACFSKCYQVFRFTLKPSTTLRFVVFISLFSGLFFGGLQFLNKPIVHISFGVVLSFVLVVSTGVLTPKTLKKLSRRNPSDN